MSNIVNIFIGIDPDVEKSGVAFYERESKHLELSNLTFFEVFDYFAFLKQNKKENNLTVVIEAGWLNKSNWHIKLSQNNNVSAQIGQRTGANHEVGKKIIEMCKYLELKYEIVKPTKSKISHEMFKKLTNIVGKTNQEQRDAGMLVIGR